MTPTYLADPVLRMLPPEPPTTFLRLSPREQAWRGRLFLMTWIVSGDQPFSWSAALADDEPHNSESRALVASVPDERLLAELQAAYESEAAARKVT